MWFSHNTGRFAAWLVFAIVAALIIHVYFSYSTSAPRLSYDDSLANIAIALADHNRFGFLASPLQGYSQHIRSENFYNVGYPFFFIGAALTWFFGFSIEIIRLIHPVALIVCCLFAFASFRRVSYTAPALFSLVVLILFYSVHWPSARADIMVSVFTFGALLAWSRVNNTHGHVRMGMLALASFLISNAFITHPISWGVACAMVPVWFVWLYRECKPLDRDARLSLLKRSILSSLLGIGIAVLLWGITIDFAFANLLSEWLSYAKGSGEINPLSVSEVLQRHWELGWGEFIGYPLFRYLLWVAGLCVGASILSIPYLPPPFADSITKHVVPPTAAWIGYQLSLALYPNFHTGYNVLHPLLFTWACVALIAAAAEGLMTYRPRLQKVSDGFGSLGVLLLGLAVAAYISSTDNHWQKRSAQSTDIPAMLRETIDIIPERARVWGDAVFGLDAGSRIDLIQLREALTLSENIPHAVRQGLAPDFLIVGASSKQSMVFQTSSVCGDTAPSRPVSQNTIWRLSDLFPTERYSTVKLISAQPYGTTSVYQRKKEAVEVPPTFAWNNGRNPQWTYRTKPLNKIDVQTSEPASFDLRFNNGSPQFSADRTKSLNLTAGAYVITLKIEREEESAGGIFFASQTALASETAVDSGFDFDVAPYFSGQDTAMLLVHHTGGPLYISQCDFKIHSDFSISKVEELVPLQSRPRVAAIPVEIPLPPLSAWDVMTDNGVKVRRQTDDEIDVTAGTGRTDYVALSPEIKVTPDTKFSLTVQFSSSHDNIAVGISSGRQWLVEPSPDRRISFESGRNNSIRIVVVNDRNDGDDQLTSVNISGATLTSRGSSKKPLYVDYLARCHVGLRTGDTTDCIPDYPPK